MGPSGRRNQSPLAESDLEHALRRVQRLMTETPLLITVDVEGNASEDDYDSVEILVDFLEGIGLESTLFTTPSVVVNRPSLVEKLNHQGHEVGLHIHPARFEGGESDRLGAYSTVEISRIVKRGKEVFINNLGWAPRVFRAGRWSFSDSLLEALSAADIRYDASERPSTEKAPYTRYNVTEIPMSVYGNSLTKTVLSKRGIESFPLHADAFLRSTRLTIPFYCLTAVIALQNQEYLMVSLHDYDLVDPLLQKRIGQYLRRLSKGFEPTTIVEFGEKFTP